MAHDDGIHIEGQPPHSVIDEGRKRIADEVADERPRDREHVDRIPRHDSLTDKIHKADRQLHEPGDRGRKGSSANAHPGKPTKPENEQRVQNNIEAEGKHRNLCRHGNALTALHDRKIGLRNSHKEIGEGDPSKVICSCIYELGNICPYAYDKAGAESGKYADNGRHRDGYDKSNAENPGDSSAVTPAPVLGSEDRER